MKSRTPARPKGQALVALAAVWSLAVAPARAASVCVSDVNGDASVDVVDVQCVVLVVVAGLGGQPAPACLAPQTDGDVNCDGVVDVVDAQAAIGGSLGLAPAYGACAQGAKCDDGNPCTWDECGGTGICQHAQVDCDDGNPCTVDA